MMKDPYILIFFFACLFLAGSKKSVRGEKSTERKQAADIARPQSRHNNMIKELICHTCVLRSILTNHYCRFSSFLFFPLLLFCPFLGAFLFLSS
jgi:hypothetical protein